MGRYLIFIIRGCLAATIFFPGERGPFCVTGRRIDFEMVVLGIGPFGLVKTKYVSI